MDNSVIIFENTPFIPNCIDVHTRRGIGEYFIQAVREVPGVVKVIEMSPYMLRISKAPLFTNAEVGNAICKEWELDQVLSGFVKGTFGDEEE